MARRYTGRYGRRKNTGMYWLIAGLSALLVVLIVVAVSISLPEDPGPNVENPSGSSSSSSTTQPTDPTDPPEPPKPYKVSTATFANTGDMLMHMPVVNSTYNSATGRYDFMPGFRYFKPYVEAADYAVANLETTLYGPDWTWWQNGVLNTGYSGYPGFNSPDSIAEDLQATGFDMLLTANNHSYDTRSQGFHRTQQVLENLGLNYLGTLKNEEQNLWQVQQINGIKVGMVCYTYQTGTLENVSLNGIPMSAADGKLIGTFSYNDLPAFYEDLFEDLQEMKQAGAEATVLYIHWGDEYQLRENGYQNQIAQEVCDLGVDVIVGGHPHVVQPMELLESTLDPDHKTVCLYSMGNALSNQRQEAMGMNHSYTEDGVIFQFTFAKYSDGTVILESADILPLWVNHYYSNSAGKLVYEILPLDKSLSDWKTAFDLSDAGLADCNASYDRTMGIVGEGLEEIQTYLENLVKATEEKLGVA